MTPPVHILATVRKPELLPAALFVFETLRTGFPTAAVTVWGNALDTAAATAVSQAATKAGATFHNIPATSHDVWIETLIQSARDPFWICDTDIAFWQSVEDWPVPAHLSGRPEPEFLESWMGTRHVARLHTALMQINPSPVRAAMRAWTARIPAVWRNSSEFPFVRMTFIPVRDAEPLCYDTCAGLWQAGMGTPFTEKQNSAYDHLYCATYTDVITTELGPKLRAVHAQIFKNPALARGIRAEQNEYYIQNTKGKL